MLTKDEFCTLAEATIRQYQYGIELYDSIRDVAKKHKAQLDFVGIAEDDNILIDACSNILGTDFCYYMYDCECDFDRYNKGTYLEDNTHPNVQSFEDLYKYYVEEIMRLDGVETLEKNDKTDKNNDLAATSSFPTERNGKLVRNSFHCKKCGMDVESSNSHSFATCKCGNFTDGGLDYIRRGGNFEDMEDTSIYGKV